jgi:hypothetical protein
MYECSEHTVAFSWCLLGPLFGQSIGPLLGGIFLSNLECPWLFWILLINCAIAVTGALLFLQEADVPVLLAQRQKEKENGEGGKHYFKAEDNRPLTAKLAQSLQRPLRICCPTDHIDNGQLLGSDFCDQLQSFYSIHPDCKAETFSKDAPLISPKFSPLENLRTVFSH